MSLVSLQYLEKVAYGDTSFIEETVKTFLVHTPLEIKHLRAALAAADHVQLAHRAHSLKTALRMMGMTRTAELCAHLEEEAKGEAKAGTLHGHIKEIASDCEQAYQELAEILENL